jgi:uncharacterized protein
MTQPTLLPNALINASSPYLLQHAYNPVQWMPWGEQAWQLARTQNKPVIISIGYSACHWCHVMEHESFIDPEVARVMNTYFISIKVDREERPDIDQIYMDAVQIVTGRGGWPLHAICLPDGRPFYAGTYFQKEHWIQLLQYFAQHYRDNKQELLDHADDITRGIISLDSIPQPSAHPFTDSDSEQMYTKMREHWDYRHGGRRGAPKFPMPATISWWLHYAYRTDMDNAKQSALITLDQMAAGGIYDHVGGGFARYSVDEAWTIPHFEKMLYDNAQLLSVYSDAYRYTGNPVYRDVIIDTLTFISQEWLTESGAVYTAIDADSEGIEGKYYVWSYDELQALLGDDFEVFLAQFDITHVGNFEHQLIHLRYQANRQPLSPAIKRGLAVLKHERDKRIKPSIDDKAVTAWNAMMLNGYLSAYKALNDKTHLDTAIRIATHLLRHCRDESNRIWRIYKAGTVSINGFLDDYAMLIDALIELHACTADEQWLHAAKQLTDYTIQHFYTTATGMCCYTSILDEPLITRKTETSDHVIPSSNAVMAKCLYQLGLIYSDHSYERIALQMVQSMRQYILEHTYFYAQWSALSIWMIQEPYQVVIVGPDALQLKAEFDKQYLPDCMFLPITNTTSTLPLLSDKVVNHQTLIYVCRDRTCGLPTNTVAAALLQMGITSI